MAAERDLLFGLLALQTGLIQQAQLVAAFHAWTCDKARSLADHLIVLGHLNTAQRAAVEALAALHIEAHGGDVERSLAVVPTIKSTLEGLASLGDPDIEATLGHVGSGCGSTVQDGHIDTDRTADYSVGAATSNGQRYRVLRPHSSGNLGVVFVALDQELNREVALKQILDKQADNPISRARFFLEAEVTGRLEHPGIVPVYGLGTYDHGRPFYAMRLVGGDNLKEAIDRFHADETLKANPGLRSLELRKLLRRFIDVCNAIDYAHSRGVLHRDIKPANIIVGKYGETLVVDWGLAKVTGKSEPGAGERTLLPSSSSGSSETLPGVVLGTPAYMSPEQARGELDHQGPRSDVYSLGATLYCLLTNKTSQQGYDVVEVLHRLQRGEFPRPRQLDPSIDPALEAICLKAMALQPGERYASPRLLAEDIERWMADEPVSAWHEPWTRRASRWLTRHRTGVTGVAAAVLVGMVGLCAVLAVESAANVRLSASLKRETDANTELKRSKAAVQARYDLAVEAIKTFHTGFIEDFLLREAQFKELRDRLLKSASDFYGKLGALLGKETDVASRRALAASNFELAELTRKVGRPEAALTAHRAVLAAREALADDPGSDTGTRADVGRSLTAVAILLDSTGKPHEALAAYRRSEAMLAPLADSNTAARAALAACRSRMARLLLSLGKVAEAMAALKPARADQEALAAVPGSSNDARRDLAATADELGILFWRTGNPEAALPELRAALEVQQKLADENPTVAEFRSSLASTRNHYGAVLALIGKPYEAETEYRTAVSLLQKLVAENPAVTLFRRSLAGSRTNLSLMLRLIDRPAEAEDEIRMSLAICQKLVDEYPVVADFRSLLGGGHMTLGIVLFHRGRSAEAEAEFNTALLIMQKLVTDNQEVTPFRDRLGFILINFGDLILSQGRAAEAKDLYERAITLKEPQVREHPSDMEHRYVLAIATRRLGLARRDLGDPGGAAADTRRALELCEGLPSNWDYIEKAFCHSALASLAGRPGSGVSAAEGASEADQAVEWLRKAVATGYRNGNELRLDSAMNPLRSRRDFQLLMMDLAFPADPFVRGG